MFANRALLKGDKYEIQKAISTLLDPITLCSLEVICRSGGILKSIFGYCERDGKIVGRRATEMPRKVGEWADIITEMVEAIVENDTWGDWTSALNVPGCPNLTVKNLIKDHMMALRASFRKRFKAWTEYPLKICSLGSRKEIDAKATAAQFLLKTPDDVKATFPFWISELLQQPLHSELRQFSRTRAGPLSNFPNLHKYVIEKFYFMLHNFDCERPIASKNAYNRRAPHLTLERASAKMRTNKNRTELTLEEIRKYLPIVRALNSSQKKNYTPTDPQRAPDITQEDRLSYMKESRGLYRQGQSEHEFVAETSSEAEASTEYDTFLDDKAPTDLERDSQALKTPRDSSLRERNPKTNFKMLSNASLNLKRHQLKKQKKKTVPVQLWDPKDFDHSSSDEATSPLSCPRLRTTKASSTPEINTKSPYNTPTKRKIHPTKQHQKPKRCKTTRYKALLLMRWFDSNGFQKIKRFREEIQIEELLITVACLSHIHNQVLLPQTQIQTQSLVCNISLQTFLN